MAFRIIALHCVGVGDDDVLDEEDCLPHVALVLEDFHCLLVLVELDFLGELEEELVELVEELDDAHVLGKSSLELRCEVLLDVDELVGLGWLRLDLNLEGHVAPQVLELHVVDVLGVVPRHLVHLGVDTLALPLHVGIVVDVLVLAQRPLGFDVVGALESRCHVED